MLTISPVIAVVNRKTAFIVAGDHHGGVLEAEHLNRNPAVGAYMRQIYRDLLYQDNTLVITTADGAVV